MEIIPIVKRPADLFSEHFSDGCLATAHRTHQDEYHIFFTEIRCHPGKPGWLEGSRIQGVKGSSNPLLPLSEFGFLLKPHLKIPSCPPRLDGMDGDERRVC